MLWLTPPERQAGRCESVAVVRKSEELLANTKEASDAGCGPHGCCETVKYCKRVRRSVVMQSECANSSRHAPGHADIRWRSCR